MADGDGSAAGALGGERHQPTAAPAPPPAAAAAAEDDSLLGLAQRTKATVPASGVFLVIALGVFLASHVAMVPVLAAKGPGAAAFTWGVAFLPLWVGDGLAVVLMVAAMVSSCCSVVAQDQLPKPTNNPHDDPAAAAGAAAAGAAVGGAKEGGDAGGGHAYLASPSQQIWDQRVSVAGGPNKLNHVKHVHWFGFCAPFVTLPPLPMLGLLFGFHLNMWRYLSAAGTAEGGNLFVALIPLYVVLVGGVLVPYLVCAGSPLGLLSAVAVIGSAVLVPLKVEGVVAGLTWGQVTLPAFVVLALVWLQLLYLVINDCMWESRRRLRMQNGTQRWMVNLMLLGLLGVLGSGAYVVHAVDASTTTFATVGDGTPQGAVLATLPLFLSALVLATAVVVNSALFAKDYIFDKAARPAPGTCDVGDEEWLAVGWVQVNYSGMNQAHGLCLRCVDWWCGGRGQLGTTDTAFKSV